MNLSVRIKPALLALFCITFAFGCGNTDDSQAQPEEETSENSTDEQHFLPSADTFAGSHILISYAGASRADSAITRTKEEALAKAQEIITEAKADPSKFEDLAKEHSDGPSGATGGDLGFWQKGRMVPEFDIAIEGMEVGAIGDEPVETMFGYHVMRRNNASVPHYGAEGFIVGVAGQGAPETVTRDSAAAATLVDEITAKINGDNFDELADEYNDFGEGKMFIGAFKDGDPVSPVIMSQLKTLGFNEAGGPIPLPVGYAFIKRIKLEQRSGAHILIAYAGANDAAPTITRTKEEAKAEAERIIELCKKNPENFAEFAEAHSDGPSNANGGDLGMWFKGAMVSEFDDAIDNMSVGDITDQPVESPYGFHIILKGEVNT